MHHYDIDADTQGFKYNRWSYFNNSYIQPQLQIRMINDELLMNEELLTIGINYKFTYLSIKNIQIPIDYILTYEWSDKLV